MAVAAKAAADRAPFPLTFFHDIHWPYGRRDLYYDPTSIPREYLHPYARQGILPGQRQLVAAGGVNGHLANAVVEGGPRNGVLTAIEDFMEGAPERLNLTQVRGLHGLGILVGARSLRKDKRLRRSILHLESADFRDDQLRVLEDHRIAELVRNAQRPARVAEAQRELAAAAEELARLRSRPLWRLSQRVSRLAQRVDGRTGPVRDEGAAIARHLRRASDRLSR
jgi:hypothetical protein